MWGEGEAAAINSSLLLEISVIGAGNGSFVCDVGIFDKSGSTVGYEYVIADINVTLSVCGVVDKVDSFDSETVEGTQDTLKSNSSVLFIFGSTIGGGESGSKNFG